MPLAVAQYAALPIVGVLSALVLLCLDAPRRKREKLINTTLAEFAPEERVLHLRDFRTVQPPHAGIRSVPTDSRRPGGGGAQA